jgi:hypothetical protein
LTFLLIAGYGLIGIPLASTISQSLTVAWYAVYRTMTRMGIKWKEYVRDVICPWASVFLGMLVIGWCLIGVIRRLTSPGRHTDIAVVATAAILSGLFLVGFKWIRDSPKNGIFRG